MRQLFFTRPNQTLTYPIGVWGSMGGGTNVSTEIANNLGLVGLGLNEDWSTIETSDGVYNWSTVDTKIANCIAAGFQHLSLIIANGSDKTPQWLLDSLPGNQKIGLLDTGSNHATFCQDIDTALYWGTTYHQKRLDLIAAAGAKYANHPNIVAVNLCSFCNHHSNDWNVSDFNGIVHCPTCPQPPPTQCGDVSINQPAQWIDAGWTEALMLQVGKDMVDAAADAFPKKNIKLPIGVIGAPLCADLTSLARGIEAYVATRPYADRFYMQRNTMAADWHDGTFWDTHTPSTNNDNYIKYMIRAHSRPNPPWTVPKLSGLQALAQATNGIANGCLLNGGTGAGTPCGPTCPDLCVIEAALNLGISYGVPFIEIFVQDAGNTDFYTIISDATIAMGGTPRT